MRTSFLLSLVLAASASAAPVITSVTPNVGTVAGGTAVTIKGSGFANCIICSPPPVIDVYFGNVHAGSVIATDSSTLTIAAPALLPGTYDVIVSQGDGSATAKQAFSVPGDTGPFETILLPIFTPPVHGAYGSLFVTDARAFATSEQRVNVYGAFSICGSGIVPEPLPSDPLVITIAGGTEWHLATECSQSPGRLLYVPKEQAQGVTFNERVTDTTRTSSSLGTEIPVVRSSQMTNGRIVLLDVPIDGRYRNTLRIYALRPTVVLVTTVGQPIPIELKPGANIFEPAYAQFTDFPVPVDPGSAGTIQVTIEQPQGIVAGPPMWAFITVTNNETQQITTITPDF